MGYVGSFCANKTIVENATSLHDQELMKEVRNATAVAQTVVCILGVAGNILNLKTLQSSSLQTVPFMYIRALAVCDMVGLTGVILYVILDVCQSTHYPVLFYRAHVEAVAINTSFIGGLYCAFMLTVERYRLITHPHHRQSKPRQMARWRILFACVAAFLLHVPMTLQNEIAYTDGIRGVKNNIGLLCSEPWQTIFESYKLTRECLRFACVITMTALNVIIAKKLQQTKKKRREMVLRSAASTTSAATIASASIGARSGSLAMSLENLQRREWQHLLRSFSEKKLTALMFVICLIYMLGNLPQMLIMIMQDQSTETNFYFQIYRSIGNLLEVLNHCLNFYVFCVASSEYTRAFLLNCRCLRQFVVRFPGMQRFMTHRNNGRLSTTTSSPYVAAVSVTVPREIEMREISTPADDGSQWFLGRSLASVSSPSSPIGPNENAEEPDEIAEKRPLRGILVTSRLSFRLNRPKRSLTIANNHLNEENEGCSSAYPGDTIDL